MGAQVGVWWVATSRGSVVIVGDVVA